MARVKWIRREQPEPEPVRLRTGVDSSAKLTAILAGTYNDDGMGALQAGDCIELVAGTTYTGPFQLPVVSGVNGNVPCWIRTAGYGTNFTAGTRVVTGDETNMATVQTYVASAGNWQAALRTAPSASYWKIQGLILKGRNTSRDTGVYNTAILAIWDYDDYPTYTESHLPHHVDVRHCILRGADPDGNTWYGVRVWAHDVMIRDCWFEKISAVGQDPAAVELLMGKRFTLDNCKSEAACPILFVGGGTPHVASMQPEDIVVTRNLVEIPLTQQTSSPTWDSVVRNIKNMIEFKTGIDVRVEGNVFGAWYSQDQSTPIVFTTVNQPAGGGSAGGHTYSEIRDVVFRYNILHDVAFLWTLHGAYYGPAVKGSNWTVSHNVAYNVDKNKYRGSHDGAGTFTNLRSVDTLVIEHNTVWADITSSEPIGYLAYPHWALNYDNDASQGGPIAHSPDDAVSGFVFRSNIICSHSAGGYPGVGLVVDGTGPDSAPQRVWTNGILCSDDYGGGAANGWANGTEDWTVTHNVIPGGTAAQSPYENARLPGDPNDASLAGSAPHYTRGNTALTASAMQTTHFNNFATHDYRIKAGSGLQNTGHDATDPGANFSLIYAAVAATDWPFAWTP